MSESKQLGRYELLEQLGEGGMGTVWLARLTGAAGFEKLCIVKTVLPSIAKDAEFVSRFLHEGRVLTQLSHGNIAQVLDMNEADGQLFLALEYVAGVDLSRLHEAVRAAQEFMPLPLVVALITQAAEGLGAAHRKAALDGSPLNIVHRDVSPHNIMVSYEGEVKVIDFGIAKSEARSRHTAQASVMGKLGYMAPEQARGEPVDHRADQFSLAIVAWELLSNQSWVKRGTLTEMVVAMAHPTVRPLAPTRPDVPPSLEAVVLKALSPLPEGRYATTDEFAQVLMGELLKLGPPPTKPQLGQYVRSRCAADFATQRQLLTRVSTQRSPPPEGERPKADMFAETVMRPGAAATPQSAGSEVLTAAARPAATTLAAPETTVANVPPSDLTAAGTQSAATPELPFTSPGRPAVTPAPESASPALPFTSPAPEPSPTSPARPAVMAVEPGAAEPPLTSPARPAVMGSAPEVPLAVEPVPTLTPVDRPSVRVDVPAVPARVDLPLSTGEIAVIRPKQNPAVLVLGLVAVLAVGAALFFALRSPEEKVAPLDVVVDAGARPVPKPPELVIANPVFADAGQEPAFDAGSLLVAGPQDLPPPADFPPVQEEQPNLEVSGRLVGKVWFVTNLQRRNWTVCRMTLPGQRVVQIGTMPTRGKLDLPLKRFVFDRKAPQLEGKARVDCAQGFGLIELPEGASP